jgi:hypothetical protein
MGWIFGPYSGLTAPAFGFTVRLVMVNKTESAMNESRDRKALHQAFMTFGRFGGNHEVHPSDPQGTLIRHSDIRAAWLAAREALAQPDPCAELVEALRGAEKFIVNSLERHREAGRTACVADAQDKLAALQSALATYEGSKS